MEVVAPGEAVADCTIAAIDFNLFSRSGWPRDEATLPFSHKPPGFEREGFPSGECLRNARKTDVVFPTDISLSSFNLAVDARE